MMHFNICNQVLLSCLVSSMDEGENNERRLEWRKGLESQH